MIVVSKVPLKINIGEDDDGFPILADNSVDFLQE